MSSSNRRLAFCLGFFIVSVLNIPKTYASWDTAAEPMGKNLGVKEGATAWGDFDGDGDLDLAVIGEDDTSNMRFLIFRNDGGGNFTKAAEPLGINLGFKRGSVDWGDYDGDGDLDILVSGEDGGFGLMVFRNDGGGVFTKVGEPMGANAGVYWASAQWGDYDNDGDLDIAVTGSSNVVGLNDYPKFIIFKNIGGDSFIKVAEPLGADMGVMNSSISWGDFDNDGDLDLAVSGRDNSLNNRLIIFRNNGDTNFTITTQPMGSNVGVMESSIAWGDYDGDGDLDLAVSGVDGSSNKRLIIYRNDGGGSFTNVAEPMGVNAGVVGNSPSSLAWGDYDGDGDLDLVVSGYDGTNWRFIIYRNNGGGSFTNIDEPMGANKGVSSSSIQWGDYDGDGALDMVVSGDTGGQRRFIIFRNNANGQKNVPPSAPTLLAPMGAVSAQGDTITFKWNKVTTDSTPAAAMTYNLRVGSAPGKVDIVAADTNSSDSIGNTILGNVQNDTFAYLVRNLSGGTYYWSVQAVDGGMMRSSWSPEQSFGVVATSGSNVWYVNDTSTAGDSFTTAIGNDANNGLSPSAPKRSISKLSLTLGDTIYVDAGLYTETVVIDTDNVSLIGKDSNATVIDPPGAKTTAGLYGIYADTQKGLVIKNLGVTGAYDAIHFYNVDVSTITADSACANGGYGISLLGGSDTNTVSNSTTNSNSSYGIYLDSSTSNMLSGNTANSNSSSGIFLYSDSNTVTNNTADSNSAAGIYVYLSSNNAVGNNTVHSNSNVGIEVYSSLNNMLTNNTADSNSPVGIQLELSSNNTVSNNITNSNLNVGIALLSSSDSNTVSNNTATLNLGGGIYVASSSNNRVSNNIGNSNFSYGIYLSTSSNNTVSNNTVNSNTTDGIYLSSSSNNTVTQNDARINTQYQIYIDGSTSADTVMKNNIQPSATNPDSGVYNASTSASANFTFTRNWWSTTDESKIRKMVFQKSNGDSVVWSPYRLGAVDTTSGADTTAPALPTGVTLDTSVSGKIKITWTNPTTNEETNGGSVGFNGVKIYRLKDVVDTTNWANPSNLIASLTSADTTYVDTNVFGGNSYYYRLTSRDAATFVNESFFTDTKFASPDTLVTVSLVAPVAGHETTAAMILFQWATSNDAETYTWQLSRTAAFTTIADSVIDTTATSVVKPVAANDSYFWQVVGRDRAGNFDTTVARGFVVDTTAGQVTAVSPAAGHETTVTSVVVTWNALSDSTGIDSYVVEVSKNTAFTALVIADTVSGGRTTDTLTGLYNDTYFWRVRAIDHLKNTGAYSALRGFVVDTAAGQVGLLSPADGSQTASSSVALAWAALADSTGILNYVIEVSKSAIFSSVVFADTVGGMIQSDTFPATTNDTYYWRVRAIDHLGNVGANAPPRGFVMDTGVGQVTPSSPAQGAQMSTGVVALTWNALADSVGIDSYVVEVSKATNFSLTVFADTVDGVVTSDTASGLYNDTYFWRVRSIDNLGNVGANSAVRGFLVDTSVGIVILTTPPTGKVTANTMPIFIWNALADSVGIDSYVIEVTNGSGTTVFADTVAETADTATGLMADTYYWRVRAIDRLRNVGANSDSFSFRIDTTPLSISLVSPSMGHETTAVVIYFSWSGVNAETYTWQLSRTAAFTAIADSVVDTIATSAVRMVTANDSYYWRVLGRNSLGGMDTSVVRGFVIDTSVNQVTVMSPLDGHETANAKVVVTWSALSDSTGIDSYVVEASKSVTFTALIFADTVGGARSSDTLIGLYNDTYFWRVRAIDHLKNMGAYSAARGFVVDTAGGKVVLASPASGTVTTDSKLTLAWNALVDSTGIDSYVVEVSNSPAFGSTAFVDTVSRTSDTVNPGLAGDTYFWRVKAIDHVGNVGVYSDSFILLIDTAQTLTVTAPNGSDVWTVGETRSITWITVGTISAVRIAFSTDSGVGFPNVITTTTANTGSYAWSVPDSIGSALKVRVSSVADTSVFDTSDADFKIRGGFTVTRPNGGDSFQAETAETVTWTSTGTISAVRLEYSPDSGATWSAIVASTANTGSYLWSVANASTAQVKVRVMNVADTATADTSDNAFQINPIVVPPPADTIAIVSGNHQLGTPSATLSQPLRIRVVDTGGVNGVSGANVTFTITQGSGSLYAPTVYTDASGYATDTITLSTAAGINRVEARNDSVATAKKVVFTEYVDGRDVPPGGNTLGLGWRMVGANKNSAGWNLKSTSGGLQNATVYEWRADQNDVSGLNNTKYYEPSGDAVRGRAYWVKDGTGGRVFIPTDGVAAGDTVQVSLRVGWNQVASGQYFYVSWDSGVVFDTSAINDTPLLMNQRLTPYRAGLSGAIQNKIYWYTGSNYVYAPASETPSLTTMQLKPMVGFWLKANQSCTMYVYPNPTSPETYASEILNQAPAYLSSAYQPTSGEQDWAIQLIASAGGNSDWQNYIGTKSSLTERQAGNALEAPGLSSGYLTAAVRPQGMTDWMAASYAEPITTGRTWDVMVATDLGVATLTWDNVSNLPTQYDAYLLGGTGGAVNLRKSSSIVVSQSTTLTLAVGLPEYVAPFLAAPLTKDMTFVYPNPGPDAAGNMTFKYNLQTAGDVSLKIFDVGGRLVREFKATGSAGSNTVTWDTTNRNGQRLGSGIYIYRIESGGNTLVDKLALIR